MAVAESITMIEGSETANLPFNDNAGPSASSLTNKAGNVPNRCGSAPPSLEEAFSAIRNSFLDQQSTVKNVNKGMLDSTAEERVVTDPSYIAYYNAHINLNPRLPPPLISRESRHLVGRNTGFGHARKLIADDDIDTKMRLLSTRQEELQENALPQQVLEDRIVDRDNTATLAGSSKSFADLLQQCSIQDKMLSSDTHAELQGLNDNRREVSTDDLPSTSFQHGNQDSSNSMIDGASTILKTLNISGAETSVPEHMQRKHEDMLLCETYGLPFYPANGAIPQVQRFQPQYMPQGMNGSYSGVPTFPVPYAVPSSPYMSMGNPFVPRPALTNFGSQFSLGGYTPPSPGFYVPQNMFTLPFDPRTRLNLFNRATTTHHHPFPSPLQGQYFQQSFMNNSGRDSAQFSQHAALLAQKQSNLHTLMYHDHRNLPSGHLSSSGFNPVIQFPMNGRNHLVLGDQTGIPQRTFENADLYTEHRGSNNVEDPKRHPYLESLKFGGAAKLELSDIGGRIVEFSTDQLGSRFIQQKLEFCTVQEKESVFTELLPHALRLMTDVFGNYVIQKLFEHGTSDQRKQLADQFKGQMVTLSLQMYGCRVIQKALEVIELDQKALLAQELDGHVVKCVHDQNGNHVIQKCIEHIPAEKIGFIFSALYGEVAMFSVHPYGCRVIQRALEHCSDTSATHFIIDEILDSASLLAHDQYGNYVIQHVLELGKPSERSRVISKLAGKFVEMSQHKYASNVIEKCLVHGDASEQESLIREIVGKTQEDATLLTMIKDQYANYVIQRIFDVCNDEERKILMDCVRENLESLKKYTYGKHIVARYERLESGNQEQRTG